MVPVAQRQAHRPRQVEPELERAAPPHPALVIVGRREPRRDTDERVRAVLGREPLRRADVGPAVHTDPAVAPGLARHPLDRVVPVARLVDERDELAAGAVTTSNVLDDDGVAAHGGVDGVEQPSAAARRALVIWRALQQAGKGAGGVGPEDVHVSERPVPQHQGEIGLELDRIRARHSYGSLSKIMDATVSSLATTASSTASSSTPTGKAIGTSSRRWLSMIQDAPLGARRPRSESKDALNKFLWFAG